jgi:NadR type nicotinamide-nucleotide adenylyltransferase
MYKSAFVFGKLLPPHKGHLHLINTALKKSEKVNLLLCSLNSEPIPGKNRLGWIREIYKNEPRINIIHCSEDLPQTPEEDPNFWNIWVNVAKRYCPNDIDVLFTSELYGELYANHLNIKHHLVDIERITVPVSGTKVRANPFENWEFIPNEVRPYFVKRVAIVGPESVGKSTLTRKLANFYFTNFVDEYGRIVYENNGNKISIEDFIPISKGRQDLENWMLETSNKLLFCDTEDITTYIFSKMYFPNEYTKTLEYFNYVLSTKKPYDIYILLKPDCDAIQDGTRNFLDERWDHYNVLREELTNRRCNFVEIGGSWEDRLNDSIKLISNTYNIDNRKILPIK